MPRRCGGGCVGGWGIGGWGKYKRNGFWGAVSIRRIGCLVELRNTQYPLHVFEYIDSIVQTFKT